MPVVSIFSGSFCRGEETVEALREATGYLLIKDDDIVKRAAELCKIPAERLSRCLSARLSAFNPFTRELERSISWLKLAIGEYLQENNFILHGCTSHLIPPLISHALNVCIISDLPYRIRDCAETCNIAKDEAVNRIVKEDSRKAAWVDLLKGSKDPWDSSCYDMVLPTSLLGVEKAVNLIQRGINAYAVMPTAASMNASMVFLKEAQIEAALADNGHVAHVKTNGSHATLTIDRPVMMLQRLEEELREIVTSLPGIDKMEINVDPKPGKNEIYRKFSVETPSRVLLVDDEREFVQTLSERLEMREIGSVVAYDGESALEMLANDEPDVMLLDLQMPGINGIEVLKRVKKTKPEIEVIILTGHGTQKDRDICMQTGAFAYLEKPVDIEILSKTLSLANDKMRQNQKKGRF